MTGVQTCALPIYYDKSTFGGEYNALFAIQSVPMLLRYYKIFKELNPKIRIGAIFTYAATPVWTTGRRE